MASQRPVGYSAGLTFIQPAFGVPPIAVGMAGYLIGGYDVSSPNSRTDKMLFITESVAPVTSNLEAVSTGCSACTLFSGYDIGGALSAFVGTTRIHKLSFSSDSWAYVVSTLTSGASITGGYFGYYSTSVAYKAGGYNNGSALSISGIEKLTFSSDTVVSLLTSLPATASYGSGVSSAVSGYCFSGRTGGNTLVSTIYKQVFSSEAVTTLVSGDSLVSDYNSLRGLENSAASKAYVGGGYTGSSVSTMRRLDLSLDAVASMASTLSVARYSVGAMKSKVAGYYGGGYSTTALVDKLTFSTESMSIVSTTLTIARYSSTGFENLN